MSRLPKNFSDYKKTVAWKKAQIFCSDYKKKFNALTLLTEKSTALVTEAKAECIPKADFNQTPSPKNKPELNQHSIAETLSKLPPLLVRQSSPEAFDQAPNSPVEGNIQSIGSVSSKIIFATNKPVETEPAIERLLWEIEKKPANVNWFVGFIICFVFLTGQLAYFESGKLSQKPSYRPVLEKLCRWLGCHVADYQNLDEFAVLQGSFKPNGDNTITFKAVINNQAAFKQRLPNSKLTLLDYNEQIFAQRIFDPKDHISGVGTHLAIAPDATVAVSLTVAAPKTPYRGAITLTLFIDPWRTTKFI
ncbi:MAG: DUF3426 domain-containing protein [Proteobacteria bacterium]|nr:DUF3426 domain-containing protein [Pseudomonadota bacterium]